jgi:hypothetical protein
MADSLLGVVDNQTCVADLVTGRKKKKTKAS